MFFIFCVVAISEHTVTPLEVFLQFQVSVFLLPGIVFQSSSFLRGICERLFCILIE